MQSTERIVRVEVDGSATWGILRDAEVYALPDGPYGENALAGERLGDLATLKSLAPAIPSKIICVGRNYADHAREHDAEVPEEPALFLKPPSSLAAPGSAVVCPPQSERVEHEGELVLVMARGGRHIPTEDAWRYVLGVTCGNDVTARDLQRSDVQWTRAKGFDTFCPIGPWLVAGSTEDAVADLAITCRVNGDLRQSGRTSQMVFSPAVIVSYISSVMTLEPGDVIMTGTPAGVGPLHPGDQVEVEIEGIGVLKNPIR
jgi:2-keto-4-pentenoate hydratase/2-oxohepta-3-ene-1,7-dioic acid hydratase in catechol pathway